MIDHDLWSGRVVAVERNLPGPAGILTVTDKELLLAEYELTLVIRLRCDDRVAGLFKPGVHNLADVEAGSVAEGLPEVISGGIIVLVGGEVVLQTFPQCFITKERPHHH